MMTAILLAAAFGAASASPPPVTAACLDVSDLKDVEVTLEGRVTRHVFAGPPNYEDVGLGDAPEPTYILELRSPLCLYDGEIRQIDRAHLYTTQNLWAPLHAARGHSVRIHGRGFGETTGHHHAPLVVDVDEIVVERP
jgi:hypothetical protein